jgi:hypothetical protein
MLAGGKTETGRRTYTTIHALRVILHNRQLFRRFPAPPVRRCYGCEENVEDTPNHYHVTDKFDVQAHPD